MVRIFTIYKLRTMHRNAEKDGAQWAKTNDSRITGFGNFLRQTRLDEVPQCWERAERGYEFCRS